MSGVEQADEQAWMRILREQTDKTSISDVARQIGYSRPTVSLVLSGDYKGGTGKIAAAVIAKFTNHVQCPFLGYAIEQAECGDHQSRPMPTSDPHALRHWHACQDGCPYNYQSEKREAEHA